MLTREVFAPTRSGALDAVAACLAPPDVTPLVDGDLKTALNQFVSGAQAADSPPSDFVHVGGSTP